MHSSTNRLIVSAGSGKTLAFGIPMLTGILEDMEREKEEKQDDDQTADFENDDALFDSDEFEDMSDEEAESGCVRVVNDVVFDFEDENDDGEVYAPPLEVVEELDMLAKVKTGLRGLVLAPTRELAVQVKNHLEAAAKHTSIRVRNFKKQFVPSSSRNHKSLKVSTNADIVFIFHDLTLFLFRLLL